MDELSIHKIDPLNSDTAWIIDLWSKIMLLKLQNKEAKQRDIFEEEKNYKLIIQGFWCLIFV